MDLDFFSQDLFPDEHLLGKIKLLAKKLKIKKIEEQKRFNRHEFWLKRGKETVRTEFVFYPFPYIKKPKKLGEFNLKIDSIEDILTNKAHAIFERTEPKDAFDFYCILRKKKIRFFRVLEWVKKKFGVEIDPVLFTSKILEGIDKLGTLKPLVLKKELFMPKRIEEYFQKQTEGYLKIKIRK